MNALSEALSDRLTVSRPQRAFFDALAAVGEHLRDHDHLAHEASWAPPVRSVSSCSCGRVLEIRSERLELDTTELAAVVAQVGDEELVDRVVAAINQVRADADDAARQEFWDAHETCGYES